jgi:hypothetical protein
VRSKLADLVEAKTDKAQFAENTTEARYTMAAKKGQPILVGVLLKKNNWFMKQERIFELYPSGEVKYFTNDP